MWHRIGSQEGYVDPPKQKFNDNGLMTEERSDGDKSTAG